VTHHLASKGGVTRRVSLGFDAGDIGGRIEDSDSRIDCIEFGNELAQRRLRVLDLASYLRPLPGKAADDVFVFHPRNLARRRSISCGGCAIIPEFQAQVLDSLRQPIETGEVAIARANHRVVYPARFQLIAAMNPCRCGSANEPGYACRRAPNERCVAQYLGRLSGPLIDRFDLVVDVPSVSAADLMTPPAREGSAEVAARVGAARKIQLARYAELGLEGVVCNARAPASIVEEIAEADASGLALLRDAAERLRLSARGYHRVLKLARTLADLDGGGPTRRAHLAEALSYRGAPDRAAAAA
jgi:magnesium chelatase family protein